MGPFKFGLVLTWAFIRLTKGMNFEVDIFYTFWEMINWKWLENCWFLLNFLWIVGPLKFDFGFWFYFDLIEELADLSKVWILRLIFFILFEKWSIEKWLENSWFFVNFKRIVGPLKFDFGFWFYFDPIEELADLLKVWILRLIFFILFEKSSIENGLKNADFSWTLDDSWGHLSSILRSGVNSIW